MPFSSTKIRVGVLRGGPSDEYDVSIKTGATILANLPEEYEPIDIFISKEGTWHTSGLQKDPYKILKAIDVAVNALHGAYGEDGTVQKLLEHFNIPYTGSDSMASALGMNKIMSKNVFEKYGIKTPQYILIEKNEEDAIKKEMIEKINEAIPFPLIIKPISSGSSLGISFVNETSQIKEALKNSFKHSPKLLVEEFIKGKEATCGVIEGFRGAPIYSLLPVEVVDSKYKIPGNFREDEKKQIAETAILIHKALGLRHYSRSDFILHSRRGLFCLEVNTLPELSHRSSFVKSLEAVGGNIKEFLGHLLSQTLGR